MPTCPVFAGPVTFIEVLFCYLLNDLLCYTHIWCHNVWGLIQHRLFRLPVEHDGKTPKYYTLPTNALKQMHLNLSALRMVITDETSMVYNLTLAYIH